MNDQNTGLGDSLLLRRTDEPRAAQPITDAQTSRRPEHLDVPESKRPARKVRPLRDRCTIYLEPDVNRQLDLVARLEHKQRSEVVAEILRTHLPRYEVRRESPSGG